MPLSFSLQPQNGIQITSWFSNPADRELLNMIPILEALSKEKNLVQGLQRQLSSSSSFS
jgi:TFIIF-interacting CTD phosphatase-like protein